MCSGYTYRHFEDTIYQNDDMDLMLFAINNIVGELENIIVLNQLWLMNIRLPL